MTTGGDVATVIMPTPDPVTIPTVNTMIFGSINRPESISPRPIDIDPKADTNLGPLLSWALPNTTMARTKLMVNRV